ncbi:hypothetical protein [Malacoplasma muris]|uniref:hypothetical protein n=1 Tax=Malacoplasma muris TaxID=2119 RepID=UPI00398EF9A1
MGLFKNNKKEKKQVEQKSDVQVNDGWMREDFILVSNRTKAKDLKPYQRLVVLRKPDGEQKCIIDKSLPFREIERIQELINKKGFVDINSKEFTRIIPNDFKTESDIFEESKESVETSALAIKRADNSDYIDFLVDPNKMPKSILKLEDDKLKYKLDPKHTLKSNKVDDVDLIDDIEIYIPHEDRKLRWDTIDENDFSNNVDHDLKQVSDLKVEEEIVEDNSSLDDSIPPSDYIGNIEESVEVPQEDNYKYVDQQQEQEVEEEQQEVYNENIYEPSDEYASEQPELEMQSTEEFVSDELTTENFEHEIPKETVTSFFKNTVEYDSSIYDTNRQPSGNYYKFYEDTNNNPLEAKVVNKKVKMIIRRKKIDEKLIEANALKRQGLR